MPPPRAPRSDLLLLGLVILAVIGTLGWGWAAGLFPAPVPQGNGAYDDEALARVLRGAVVDGLVHYRQVEALRGDLAQYLATLARVSPDNHPEAFPTSADRVAYWLNAHRALVLEDAVGRRHGPSGPSAWSAAHFRARPIGGKRMTEWAIERRLSRIGDPRVWFALNRGAWGEPAVAPAPFRGDRLDAELGEAAQAFIQRRSTARIDGHALHLTAYLKAHEEAFLTAIPSSAPNLLQLVWAFLPDHCVGYSGCLTRGELDQTCGRTLRDCQVIFDPVDEQLNDPTAPSPSGRGSG